MRNALCLAVVCVVLSACGENSERYSTLVELRNAAVAAGLACPEWTTTERHDGSQQGTCSDYGIVVLFDDEDQRDAAVEDLQETMDGGGYPYTALVGENWLVNSPQAPELADALGGELVSGE